MNARSVARIAVILLALASTGAHAALAQRTFVASNGVDINPCSITQPCRSFGAAIGRTVPNGEVIVLDSAGYGPVTITQSVSIIAPAGVYAGISVTDGKTGVAINGANIVVTLRGLSINGVGPGTGIHFIQGARLRVEGCVVSNMTSSGIIQDAAGSEMVVLDTIVRDNIGAGVLVQTDASAVFDNFRAEHNAGDGVFVLAGRTIADATIRRSVLSHNGGAGVFAAIPPSPARTALVIEDSIMANNVGDGVTVGGISTGVVDAAVSRSAISGNGLSGVSVFATNGFASAEVTENTFGPHPISHTKANSLAVVGVSRNVFAYANSPAFHTTSGASTVTFGDNTGSGGGFGAAPTVQSPF